MAANYRQTYASLPSAPLLLVVDINPAVAETVAQELGAARWSVDWRDALVEDIALVDISTPNHLHEEQAVTLLGAGKHVILQKPMAPTVKACVNIVVAAEAAERQAAVYMSDLEDPAVWELREMVQGGYLGRITGVRARYAHRGGLRVPADTANYWRSSLEKTGGGAFIQLSIHHINLLSWLIGDQITSVMAYSKNLCCPHIEGDDTTVCVAEFEKSGALGVFESAWNAEGSGFEICGTEGTLRFCGTEGGNFVVHSGRPYGGETVIERGNRDRNTMRGAAGTHNQHRAFVEAVQAGTSYPQSATIGLHDVAVCQAVYRSAQEGRRVTLLEVLETCKS
jgi:predicted dehydrogenase